MVNTLKSSIHVSGMSIFGKGSRQKWYDVIIILICVQWTINNTLSKNTSTSHTCNASDSVRITPPFNDVARVLAAAAVFTQWWQFGDF